MENEGRFSGSLFLASGPMYSEKTKITLQRALLYRKYGGPVIGFRPQIDTRGTEGVIEGRNNHERLEAFTIPVDAPEQMIGLLEAVRDVPTKCAFIDEIQFFNSEKIFLVVKKMLQLGYDVIANGLDLDFRGLPFGATLQLVALTQPDGQHVPLYAHCFVCGRKATRTQRLDAMGNPVSISGRVVEIEDGKDHKYEARCLDHHETPE